LIDEKRVKEAQKNFAVYLGEYLIKKEKNETAKAMYLKNADLSLRFAEEAMNSRLRPFLWVIVVSYYSMFYMANAVLLELGYKTGEKAVHKVTHDALIVLVMNKIKKGLIEEYENAKQDAFQIASIKSEEIISLYSLELDKRSKFQYNMTKTIEEKHANTSLKRAKIFMLEMKKLFPI